jgi:threonine/homoserine/homoserine lactone efflux protein
MIEAHTYVLFIGAVVVLVLAPGPDMAYMLARTLAQGRKAGAIAALGINAGAYVHVAAAVTGLSAVLATSSTAFTVVKWLGACYLIWIGVRAIRSNSGLMDVGGGQTRALDANSIFLQGFLSDVLNPKVAIFFLAFLPQFVEVGSQREMQQLLLLGVTGNMVAIALNLALVYFAGAATERLRASGKLALWLNRTMGGVFIALGIRLAREKL